MAKVYPAAQLPVGDRDVPLTDEEFQEISFLARLSRDRQEKLLKYPGAMRLRHVKAGDVICRQNDPGSTAFFILRGVDWFRVLAILKGECAIQSGVGPPHSKEESAETRRAVKQVEAVLKGMDPARQARLERACNADEQLKERRRVLQDRLDARLSAEAQLKKIVQEAEKSGGKEKAAALKTLLQGTPEQKRQHAVSMQDADPETARLLLNHALTPDEVKGLQKQEGFLRTASAEEKQARAKEIEPSDPTLAGLLRDSAAADEKTDALAHVYLTAGIGPAKPAGFWARLKNWFLGMLADEEEAPRFLPSDGPTDLDFRTRRASLFEGDLFGEMACLNRRARSATVKAAREGFLLEVLGNVLDEIDKDPDYQKERQSVYRRRVLESHLRELALFSDLSEADYARVLEQVRDKVELVTFTSGQVICDEHDHSDCIYLVRDGIVQVVKNVSALLRPEDVRNWSKLAGQVKGGSGPVAAVLKLMPPGVVKLLQETPTEDLAEKSRVEVRAALNDLLKSPKLHALAEMKGILESDRFKQRGYYLPAERKTWTESQLRRGQRLLLEEMFAETFEPLPAPATGGDLILTYLSRGEVFGEIGVVGNIPRTATCLAYGQPRLHADQKDLGRVELVRISRELVHDLLDKFPILKERIGKMIETRRQRTQSAVERRAIERRSLEGGQESGEAARLGLIQGQRLMLIDLERCTRCDECVQACADSHADGRTRLFLAGPRYGKYLVPFTCRSCLDPVCMIGCPVRSIQRGDNLEIEIKDWCIGCGICARQCPYNSIQIHPLLESEDKVQAPEGGELVELRGRAAVCDLCSSLADQKPRCVYACPHEAALRVDFRSDFPALAK